MSNFQILTPRDHVRMRPGMYIGSTAVEVDEGFIMGVWRKRTYIPGLLKIINEIIDNSVDEAIRTNFKFANKIDIELSDDICSVSDNGRGIPQVKVKDPTTGTELFQPVAAWTRTNAGTSFEQGRETIGANGVGSACTNFFSKSFTGYTWRDGVEMTVDCTDGANTIRVEQAKRAGNGTQVTFEPDFSLFDCQDFNNYTLGELDTFSMIEDRIASLQVCYPEIVFSFNSKSFKKFGFKDYAEMYSEGGAVVGDFKGKNFQCFFWTTGDLGYRTNSYINGVNTSKGGSYVEHIVNSVVDHLMVMIKKKYKFEVSKSHIKNSLLFVMSARQFKDPKYDSQTKERLTNSWKEVDAHFNENAKMTFVQLANEIFKTPAILDPIIEAQLAKQIAAERRAATMAQKKATKIKVAKHLAAKKAGGTLFVCEGDSAIGYLISVRKPEVHGGFPLRGVIPNVWGMSRADVMKNKELFELVACLGLDINDPDSVDQMYYQNVAILTDSDHDGSGHISPLLMAFFYKFWPRMFVEGRVKVTRTPILISTKGKAVAWAYDYNEASLNKQKLKGYTHRYIKGLGSLEMAEYSEIINNPVFSVIRIDDPELFEMMYGPDANKRKVWLQNE